MATILDTKTPLKSFKEESSVKSTIPRKTEQKCTGTQLTGRKTTVGENHALIERTFNQEWEGTELGRKGIGVLKKKAGRES